MDKETAGNRRYQYPDDIGGEAKLQSTRNAACNPNGRPKGAKNKAGIAIKEFFRELLDDPAYAEAFILAWRARTLHPSLEQMGYHYAHGKPVQSIDLGVTFDPMKHLADLARKAGIAHAGAAGRRSPTSSGELRP